MVDNLGMWFFQIWGAPPSYTQGNRTYLIHSMLEKPKSYFTDNTKELDSIVREAKKLGDIKDDDGNHCFDVTIDYRPLSMSNIHSYSIVLTSPDDLFYFITHGTDYKLNPKKRHKLARPEQYLWLLNGAIRTDYLKSLFKSKVLVSACYHWPNRNSDVGHSAAWIENEKRLKEEFEKYSANCQKCVTPRKIVIASGPIAQDIPHDIQKHVINDKDSDPGVEYEPN